MSECRDLRGVQQHTRGRPGRGRRSPRAAPQVAGLGDRPALLLGEVTEGLKGQACKTLPFPEPRMDTSAWPASEHPQEGSEPARGEASVMQDPSSLETPPQGA